MLRTITLSLALAALIGLPSRAGEPACNCGCNSGCGCEHGCQTCSKCCPQCGCKLVPVCHVYCTTKKVTEYKYTCICEDVCIPGVTPCCCKRCESCGCCNECGCQNGNNGCEEGCCGKCRVREISKLVKIPVCKEVPVRKCTVEWVCPNCNGNCNGNCQPDAAPMAPATTTRPTTGQLEVAPLPGANT